MTGNPFEPFIQAFAKNRLGFAREVMGADPIKWQAETLTAMDEGEDRLSIRSGHGVGKSMLLATCALHHIVCKYPQKTVVTAPSAPQLFDAFFAELRMWLGKLPLAIQQCLEVTSDRVYLKADAGSFISCRTARAETPEALAGVHAKHVLLLADEASGIPMPIFESASGSMSTPGAIMLLTGNPLRTQGFFYSSQTEWADEWWTRKVSCLDDDVRASSFANPKFPVEQRKRFGLESNTYRVRVLGEFPTADDRSVIPIFLIEDAVGRDVALMDTMSPVWGVDVARFGSDASALAKRHANILLEPVKTWQGLDTMELTGRIVAEYRATAQENKPVNIFVDAIGLGAGVADRLREVLRKEPVDVVDVNVSESPSTGETYMRLRDELWFKCREWLDTRKVTMPSDPALVAELAGPQMSFSSGGKIVVESKDSMRKRGVPSPNRADALNLTFAYEGAILSGAMASLAWNKKYEYEDYSVV